MQEINILIVEDEFIIAKQTEKKIQKLGYASAGIVGTAEEALECAKTSKPDLVLMDIKLRGGIDGISAAQIIRKDLQIPVIYISAYSDDKTISRITGTEPSGYIVKPYTEAELKTNIAIALYKNQTEQAIRKSERQFRLMFQYMNEGIFLIDIDMKIIYCNKKIQQLTERSFDGVRGKDLFSFFTISPEQKDRIVKAVRQEKFVSEVIKTGLPGENGMVKHVQLTFTKFPDEDETNEAVMVVLNDLSEYRMMIESVSESPVLQPAVCGDTRTPCIQINCSDLTIVNANGCFLEKTQFADTDLIGKSAAKLADWNNLNHLNNFLAFMQKTNSVHHDLYLSDKNGNLLRCSGEIQVMPGNERAARILTFHDWEII